MSIAARNAAFAAVLTAMGAGAALSQSGTTTMPATATTVPGTAPTTPGPVPGTPGQSSTTTPGSRTVQPMVTMPNANAYAPQNGAGVAMPNANSYTRSSPATGSTPGSSVLPTQNGCPTVAGTNGCLSNPTTPAASTPRPSPQGTLQPTACPNGQTPPPGQTSCPS